MEYLIKFFGDGPVAFFGEVWKVYDLVNVNIFINIVNIICFILI